MRAGVPYFLRFTSKFFLEILPAALASVIGGFLFAQYHTSTPAPKPVPDAISAVPADRLAVMVDEEHTMLLDYLKRDQGGDKAAPAATPTPTPPPKPRAALAKETASAKEPARESVVKLRRPPASAESRTASLGAPPAADRLAATPLVAPAAPVRSPIVAAPGVAMPPVAAATASAPLPISPPVRSNDPLVIGEADRAGLADIAPRAPEPESRGVIGTVLSGASAIKDKAVNATGDAVTFVVHDIPNAVLPSRDRPQDTTAAPAGDTAQASPTSRLSDTSW